MELSLNEKVKQSIQNLKNKKSRIYFLVQGGVTELMMNGIQDLCNRRIHTAWQ